MSEADDHGAARPLRSAPRGQRVLAVALCGGARCAGLHRLRDVATREPDDASADGGPPQQQDASPGSAHPDVCGAGLRAAIGERSDAVLLTIGCPGSCHLGGVAAVGWASAGRDRLAWLGRPRLVAGVEESARKSALADWVRTGAPDAERLPRQLR